MAKKGTQSPGHKRVSPTAGAALAGISLGAIAPPPAQGAPLPPTAAGGLSREEVRRLHHPLASQIALAEQAAKELQQQGTTYAQLFGAAVPDAAGLASKLAVAAAWSHEHQAASLWETFAKTQDELAWHEVLSDIQGLHDVFVAAATKNPSIGTTFPALAVIVGARTVTADRGVATKQANKKAKAAPPK